MNGSAPGHLLGYKLGNIYILRTILSRLLEDTYGECLSQAMAFRRYVSIQIVLYLSLVCSLIGCLFFWQFIAVHIRRGDFGKNCNGSDNCYLSLATFQKKVDDMKAELLETKGIDIKKVMLMSGMFRLLSNVRFSGSYQMQKKTNGTQNSGEKSENSDGYTSTTRKKALWRSTANGISLLLMLLLRAWQLGLWALCRRLLASSVRGGSRTGMVGLPFLFHELTIKKVRIRSDWV